MRKDPFFIQPGIFESWSDLTLPSLSLGHEEDVEMFRIAQPSIHTVYVTLKKTKSSFALPPTFVHGTHVSLSMLEFINDLQTTFIVSTFSFS